MIGLLRQIGAVTAMNLRSIPSRLGSSLVIVIGIAGVVGVMVALLAMGRGFQATLASTGDPSRALVLRSGSLDEMGSSVMREQANIVADLPGVARGADGEPLAVAEMYLLIDVNGNGDDSVKNIVVRGTDARALELRGARIVEGRMFEPGVREVIVGSGARAQFPGLEPGATVDVRDGAWTIVGMFDSGGDVHGSELWVDREALATAARRDAWNSVTVQLTDAEVFDAYRDALTADPRLTVSVQREPEYYASRSEMLHALINGLGYSVTVIMAIGAVFGALNTMYAAIATRAREIATLRALGFGGLPVVCSVLLEALLLALLGALLGGGIAWVLFNGFTVSTINFQTFSQIAFAFEVSPALLMQGIVWALVIGAIGGLFPAIRAARLPVADALRAN